MARDDGDPDAEYHALRAKQLSSPKNQINALPPAPPGVEDDGHLCDPYKGHPLHPDMLAADAVALGKLGDLADLETLESQPENLDDLAGTTEED